MLNASVFFLCTYLRFSRYPLKWLIHAKLITVKCNKKCFSIISCCENHIRLISMEKKNFCMWPPWGSVFKWFKKQNIYNTIKEIQKRSIFQFPCFPQSELKPAIICLNCLFLSSLHSSYKLPVNYVIYPLLFMCLIFRLFVHKQSSLL